MSAGFVCERLGDVVTQARVHVGFESECLSDETLISDH